MTPENATAVRESVQRQFGRVAAHYASSDVHAGGPELDALLGAYRWTGVERVLDAGCGTGHTALALASHVAEVVAVDLTDEMLAEGRRLAAARAVANVTFERGDVESLPFATHAFDVVTSRYSAHHFAQPAEALRQIARVVKPGGVVLLADVVAPDDAAADEALNAIEALRDPSHVRDRGVGEWSEMLDGAGFSTDVIGAWPLRLNFKAWVERMQTGATAIARIREVLDAVAPGVRETLALGDDYSFTVPVALIRGRRPDSATTSRGNHSR